MTTIALTGGGTAGHITPLRAVGEVLTVAHPGVSLVVVGSARGREAELLPEGFGDIIPVPKLPFPRSPNADAYAFPSRFARTVASLRREFVERSVDVVAGFGGYIAAPAYVAAWREKIPLVIHEANALPGLANRLGARLTSHVATCFPGTPLPHARSMGMPLPRQIVDMDRGLLGPEAESFFGLDRLKPTLLIMGGSSGAKKLNEAIISRVPAIIDRGWQILHLVGPTLEIPTGMPDGYIALDYCRRMDLAYAAADMVMSRAGAATVSELAIAGVASVLVPYHVGNGEQEKNGRYLVDAGAAVMVAQSEFTDEYLDAVVLPLLDNDDARTKMARAAKRLAVTDAAETFAQLVWMARAGGDL